MENDTDITVPEDIKEGTATTFHLFPKYKVRHLFDRNDFFFSGPKTYIHVVTEEVMIAYCN